MEADEQPENTRNNQLTNPDKMKEKLRPCPFCGSTALKIENSKAPTLLGFVYSLAVVHDPLQNCHACPATMFALTEEELVSKWNARASNMPKMENTPPPRGNFFTKQEPEKGKEEIKNPPPALPKNSNPEAARLEELLQAEQLTKAEAEELAGYGWRSSIEGNRYRIYKVDRGYYRQSEKVHAAGYTDNEEQAMACTIWEAWEYIRWINTGVVYLVKVKERGKEVAAGSLSRQLFEFLDCGTTERDPMFAQTRRLQVLQYRYDDGSGAKPVRAYLEGDPLAAQDLELMNGQASDSKRWSLEPVPFFLPPFKNSKQ